MTGTDARRFMGLTQMLHRNAQASPDAIATRFGDRACTWSELKQRVARLAAALQARGLKEEDRVAILALNRDRYTEYYFAVWWAGGVVVPLNTRWSAAENVYSLNDSGARILLVDDAFKPLLPDIRSGAKTLETFIYLGEETCPPDMVGYEAMIAAAAPAEDRLRAEDDLAGLFYTGGTTGFPKGVMLGHRGLWYNAMVIVSACRIEADSVCLHAAPMFHLADGAMAQGINLAGAQHAYVPAFDPSRVLDLIEAHGVTHLLLVPTMIGMLLQSPSYAPDRLKSVQNITYGGSPMPSGILRQALEDLPHVNFVQAYGQTEMSPVVSLLAPADHVLHGPHVHRQSSAGKVALGCEVKIVGEDGKEVPQGEVGEVVARSPGSMLGYWNLPEQTAATLDHGWVRTGDGACVDKDGYLYIVDRMKDMIVTGGENVFSVEVENAISTFPGVASVAVVGIPSDRWGEAVHAIVVPKAGAELSGEAIVAHCRTLIANYKLPRSVEIRKEPLPVSGAGKILKRDLRAPFWQDRKSAVN